MKQEIRISNLWEVEPTPKVQPFLDTTLLLRFSIAKTTTTACIAFLVLSNRQTTATMPDLTSSLLSNWKCLAACTLVSMSPFQYGIDFGAIGGLQAMRGFLEIFGHPDPTVPTGYNISTERQQLISSLMTLGAFLSSSFAGVFATRLGRRQCLWMASVLCCVANIVMMTTTSMGGLYAGRLLIGIANGWYMTFSQLYIQVCFPFPFFLSPSHLLSHNSLTKRDNRNPHQHATAVS